MSQKTVVELDSCKLTWNFYFVPFDMMIISLIQKGTSATVAVRPKPADGKVKSVELFRTSDLPIRSRCFVICGRIRYKRMSAVGQYLSQKFETRQTALAKHPISRQFSRQLYRFMAIQAVDKYLFLQVSVFSGSAITLQQQTCCLETVYLQSSYDQIAKPKSSRKTSRRMNLT